MQLNSQLPDVKPSAPGLKLNIAPVVNGPTPPQSRDTSSVDLKFGFTAVVSEINLEEAQNLSPNSLEVSPIDTTSDAMPAAGEQPQDKVLEQAPSQKPEISSLDNVAVTTESTQNKTQNQVPSLNLKQDDTVAVSELAQNGTRDAMLAPNKPQKQDRASVAQQLTPPLTRTPSPAPLTRTRPHVQVVMTAWEKFTALQGGDKVILDGASLDIPSVVAVAKYEKLDHPTSTG
jgi:hypothetical protein